MNILGFHTLQIVIVGLCIVYIQIIHFLDNCATCSDCIVTEINLLTAIISAISGIGQSLKNVTQNISKKAILVYEYTLYI